MVARFVNRLKVAWKRFFLSPEDSHFIRMTKDRSKSGYGERQRPLNLLIQMPEDSFYLLLFSALIRVLRDSRKVEPAWISVDVDFRGSSLLSWFRNSDFSHRRWRKLYLSNGGKMAHENAFRARRVTPHLSAEARSIFEGLKSKDDVLGIRYLGLNLGDLIYDTYLRFKPAETVDLADPFLHQIILSALDNALRQERLFHARKFDFLVTSYSSYVQHGVMVRMALKHGVRVLSFGSYIQFAKEVSPEFPSHVKDYRHYREIFSGLPEIERTHGLAVAEKRLAMRFNGGVDSSTSYMSHSAFRPASSSGRHFEASGRKRVVLFLHCFFDSPHIYREMHYPDFLEWALDSARILKEMDCDFYFKSHPNGLDGNEEIVRKILELCPWIKVIPKSVSNMELVRDGFDLALTVYGTLAHEFPYFGIPVLNCGDNPHVNYNFSIHPGSREEYRNYLRRLVELPQPGPGQRDAIHEFYFMHSIHHFPGMLSEMDNAWVNRELRNAPDLLNPEVRSRLDGLIEGAVLPFFKEG